MQPWLITAVQALVLLVMLAGLVGLMIPIFPGVTVIWLAALGYGVATAFSGSAWIFFAIITILMLAGNIVDNVIMNATARSRGASWLSLGTGLLAGIAGSLLLPPLGGIPAAILAVFAVELIRLKDWRKALHLTGGMALGCGWAYFARVGIGMLMIGLWVIWAFA
ncbi:MAG: DUF456 domain-containing protein [Chloroflexi bacterium]|nr:DUF456 domain-containing protein [Chloroflexota bacterium]